MNKGTTGSGMAGPSGAPDGSPLKPPPVSPMNTGSPASPPQTPLPPSPPKELSSNTAVTGADAGASSAGTVAPVPTVVPSVGPDGNPELEHSRRRKKLPNTPPAVPARRDTMWSGVSVPQRLGRFIDPSIWMLSNGSRGAGGWTRKRLGAAPAVVLSLAVWFSQGTRRFDRDSLVRVEPRYCTLSNGCSGPGCGSVVWQGATEVEVTAQGAVILGASEQHYPSAANLPIAPDALEPLLRGSLGPSSPPALRIFFPCLPPSVVFVASLLSQFTTTPHHTTILIMEH